MPRIWPTKWQSIAEGQWDFDVLLMCCRNMLHYRTFERDAAVFPPPPWRRSLSTAQNKSTDDKSHQPSVLRRAASVGLTSLVEHSSDDKINAQHRRCTRNSLPQNMLSFFFPCVTLWHDVRWINKVISIDNSLWWRQLRYIFFSCFYHLKVTIVVHFLIHGNQSKPYLTSWQNDWIG